MLNQSQISDDDDQSQGRINLTRNAENRLKKKSKINLKLILQIIERDMEKKLSMKQKQQLKTHKAIAAFLKDTDQKQKIQREKEHHEKHNKQSALAKFKLHSKANKEKEKQMQLSKQGSQLLLITAEAEKAAAEELKAMTSSNQEFCTMANAAINKDQSRSNPQVIVQVSKFEENKENKQINPELKPD